MNENSDKTIELPKLEEIASHWHGAEYGFGRLNSLLLLVHPEHDYEYGRHRIKKWQRTLGSLTDNENYALCVVSGPSRTDSAKQKAYASAVENWITHLLREWNVRIFYYDKGLMIPDDEEHRTAILTTFGLPLKPMYESRRQRPDFFQIYTDGIYEMGCALTQAVSFPCSSFAPPGIGWPDA